MMGGAVGLILLGLLLLAVFNRMLIRMAMRNLVRRRTQTTLIVFGLMLATVIFTASSALGDSLLYSVQASQLRQIGGIDEAVTRHQSFGLPSTAESDFFGSAQAQDVIARSLAVPSVAAAAGVIVAPGSMVDTTTSLAAAQNVSVYGVTSDFDRVWGRLHTRSGTAVAVADLRSDQVYIGKSLADRLNARAGDSLQLYVDGHLADVAVREVLDTDINPNTAWTFVDVSSVLMPLVSVRRVMNHPEGYNLILLRNGGSGGFDDLSPADRTSENPFFTETPGAEMTRRLKALFSDSHAADELKAYVNTPAIKAELKRFRDQASLVDPRKNLAQALLDALDQPDSIYFASLAGEDLPEGILLDAVDASIPQSAGAAARKTAEQGFKDRLTSLQVDYVAAGEMKALLDTPEIRLGLTQIAATLPAHDPTAATIADLITEVESTDVTPKFRAMISIPELQQALAAAIAAVAPSQGARFKDIAGRLDLYQVVSYKAEAVIYAEILGVSAVGMLMAMSFFSIAVGVLLIFLIFVMLAAERRAELGMSRALGLRRRHLIQAFVFEGTAYTLASSAVGVLLGVLVGRLMIGAVAGTLTGFYKALELEFHIEWASLVFAFCLGILLTFVVVTVSAYKVSRMNIVTAIRDLDAGESHDIGLVRMFTDVFVTAWFGVRQLMHGHPLVFVNRITLGTLRGIRAFWWALFRRGPMTIALGLVLIVYAARQIPDIAPNQYDFFAEVEYATGVSLAIIGAGLLIRWTLAVAGMRRLVADRAGFTVAALGLLFYWGRPFGRVEKLLGIENVLQVDKVLGGPAAFVISASMVLLGAIWLVMYNSDLLVRVVMVFTRRIGGLAPVTRTSTAYPMANKFRTGMAVAMFATVTFSIVFVSVFKDVLAQNLGQPDTGGWQIAAGSSGLGTNLNATFPDGLATVVRGDSTVSAEVRAVGSENYNLSPLRVVDDAFLSATGQVLQQRAAGFDSDSAAWQAVRDNAGYAVVGVVGANTAVAGGVPTDKRLSGATFARYQTDVDVPVWSIATQSWTTTPTTVTVVGLMTKALWQGIYVSRHTAITAGFFAPESTPPSASGVDATPAPLKPTGYYFMLQPGVDVNKARIDLGRILAKYGLEAVISADLLTGTLGVASALFDLVTAFLALGFVIGIAGLGVVSTRAVVERLQQIGMMRALGYRRSLVRRSFLMESSLIAILGLLIGTIVGVWLSYRFFVVDNSLDTALFHLPVAEIAGFLVLAYLTTLLMTYLPARAASRIAPAEALRYE